MTIRIRRFAPGDHAAINRLNERLRAGGVTLVVYPEGAEQDPSRPLRERLFVAADDDEIRGAVWLREHEFRVGGDNLTCGWLKYPLAESLVSTGYSGVAGSLLIHCLREQPRLFALGVGGLGTPLARMLTRLGWAGTEIPFFFYVLRPRAVLRELEPARRSGWRRAAAGVLGATGIGALAIRVAQRRRGPGPRPSSPLDVQESAEFGDWADALWEQTRDAYGFLARRDSAMLQALVPRSPDVHRLRVRRGGQDIGWACVLRHDFSDGRPDANFGRLTVGLIADGLSAPSRASDVVEAAVEWLRASGTDIIISNQAHPAWTAALRSRGFLAGPSNFAFCRAPAAERVLTTQAVSEAGCHVNRGDCDGPMWYSRA